MSTTDPAMDHERAREISRALSIFQEEFTTYLATVIAIAEVIPDQINNQIRNMMTHLARANAATDMESLNKEIGQARRHLERANRDCLKVSIMYEHERLKNLTADVSLLSGSLTPAMEAKRGKVIVDRREAYKAETRGDENQTQMLVGILGGTSELADEIAAQFGQLNSTSWPVIRFLKRFSRVGYVLIGGALGLGARELFVRVLIPLFD